MKALQELLEMHVRNINLNYYVQNKDAIDKAMRELKERRDV